MLKEDNRLDPACISWYLHDPGDGQLTWERDRGQRGRKGQLAGYDHIVRFEHRWTIQLEGRKYLRSNLVFALHKCRWPRVGFVIDHIDKNTANDSYHNLQEVTQATNMETRYYPNGHARA